MTDSMISGRRKRVQRSRTVQLRMKCDVMVAGEAALRPYHDVRVREAEKRAGLRLAPTRFGRFGVPWRRAISVFLVIFIISDLLWPGSAQAQTEIAPHLGYGIHVAPHTNIDLKLVEELGMDWVKIYEPDQAQGFPGRRILYRIDLKWPGDWRDFRDSVAGRARTVAALPIDAVEIGNEPNLINEWGHTPSAWEYVQLLRVAYTTIKAIKPNLIVVSAGLAPTKTTKDRGAISDLDYAKEMLENGAGQWFDAFGYHPYGYNMPPDADPTQNDLVFRRTERIRALMEKNGVFKQVWLTEFGWLRDPAEDGVKCSDADPAFTGFAWLRVSGEKQAEYLVRAFQYAHENWPWAGPMFVWNLNWQQMNWLNPCDHVRWFSLLRLNGERTLAFRQLQAMPRFVGDGLPRLEVRTEGMTAEVSLACPRRTSLGKFAVLNLGYPTELEFTVQPMNGIGPFVVEVIPARARIGDTIEVVVYPDKLDTPGKYPIYINVRTVVNGRPVSQSITGYVNAGQANYLC